MGAAVPAAVRGGAQCDGGLAEARAEALCQATVGWQVAATWAVQIAPVGTNGAQQRLELGLRQVERGCGLGCGIGVGRGEALKVAAREAAWEGGWMGCVWGGIGGASITEESVAHGATHHTGRDHGPYSVPRLAVMPRQRVANNRVGSVFEGVAGPH